MAAGVSVYHRKSDFSRRSTQTFSDFRLPCQWLRLFSVELRKTSLTLEP
jgi:hypothetical protein